jgi:NitT/TauT family transport system substrate-binding protein
MSGGNCVFGRMPSLDRRQLLAALTAAGGALLGPFPRRAAQADDKRKLLFITPFGIEIAYAEVLVPKAAGLFEREGLDVGIEGGKSAMQGLQQILSGQAQSARAGAINIMRAVINESAPLISIATIAQVSPFVLISAKSKPIKSAVDMVGKTIGVVARRSSTEDTLDLFLMRAGVPTEQVKREATGGTPGNYGLIEAGRIDAYVTNIGSLIRLQGQGVDPAYLMLEDGVPGQVIVAGRDAVAKEPDAFARFLRAIDRGIERIIADRQGALQLLGGFDIPILKDPGVALRELNANIDLWLARGRSNLLRHVAEDWKSAGELLVKAGMIKSADVAKAYTNELLDRARA